MLDDQERINIIKKVDAGNDQRVFFSSIRYETPIDLVGNKLESRGKICLITGIADPSPLTNQLASSDFEVLNHFKFADHHNFSKNDLLNISENMTKLAQDGMVLLTTEKDFVKLNSINQGLKSPLPLYYIPITMEFHSTGVSSFDEYMIKTLKNA